MVNTPLCWIYFPAALSFLIFFPSVTYVIALAVHCTAVGTCCSGEFSVQASTQLSFAAHIAVMLRTINARHTYLSGANISRLHFFTFDKQKIMSKIYFCLTWQSDIFKHHFIFHQILQQCANLMSLKRFGWLFKKGNKN